MYIHTYIHTYYPVVQKKKIQVGTGAEHFVKNYIPSSPTSYNTKHKVKYLRSKYETHAPVFRTPSGGGGQEPPGQGRAWQPGPGLPSRRAGRAGPAGTLGRALPEAPVGVEGGGWGKGRPLVISRLVVPSKLTHFTTISTTELAHNNYLRKAITRNTGGHLSFFL